MTHLADRSTSFIRRSSTGVLVFLFSILLGASSVARAQDPPSEKPSLKSVAAVNAWLKHHCQSCHGVEKPKGELDLVHLAFPAHREHADFARWQLIVERLESGNMPPPTVKQRPDKDEAAQVASQLRRRLESLPGSNSVAQSRAVLRRLNRNEYQNTLRDLLGIEIEIRDLLPEDPVADGFDNVAHAQHVSSFLLERYWEAADKALNLAIANYPQPPLFHKTLSCVEERQIRASTESVFRFDERTLVMFSSSPWNAMTLGQFYPPHRGTYRFRVKASALQSDDKPVTFRVEAGPMLMGTKNHLIGYFDAPPGTTRDFTWTDHLEARSTIRILPFGIANAQTVHKIGAAEYQGAGLAVHEVEVEGPIYESWPPPSHKRLFGDLRQASAKRRDDSQRVEVVSDDEPQDARKILTEFARRAFRRPVTADDIDPLVQLFQSKRDAGQSFEQAVRVALMRVLMSPDFFYLQEPAGRLDPFSLASRLSYFLWSSLPDERLWELAASGKLEDASVLRSEVDRMLADPRAKSFTENFVGQWLKLRDIDFTEPDRRLYPEYDDLLRAAMADETNAFFGELLRENLSILNIVDSPFAMLNERLARHYQVPGVEGHAIRRVELPSGTYRGGVMTMASVLKVTANGTTTSPVVRGAFVLDRILGTPPAPPPDGVPAVEPDIRGATTIREQLAKHRAIDSCAACHVSIDPPGFALENFDVIGGWREHYRSVGRGEPVTIDGRRMPYARGPKIDASDVLADGRRFADIDELKRRLLEDKRQIVRSFATKLTIYATGRRPDPRDRPSLDALVERVSSQGDGLRTMIYELVQSDLFRER